MATATRSRAPARRPVTCCPAPLLVAGRAVMDWHAHKAGDQRPCRICRRGAFCRDCTGTPCHKTCAELEHARDLAHTTARNVSPNGA